MTAYIIAAGEGSRLVEEGLQQKKPLIQINGKPMIERLLMNLHQNGFTKYNVIINNESIEVLSLLETITEKMNLEIEVIVKSTTSSLHSLYQLTKICNQGPFHLFTVDTIFKNDEFENYIKYCREHPDLAAVIATTEFIDDEKPLYVDIKDGFINSFSNNKVSGTITSGIYYFNYPLRSIIETLLEAKVERLRNLLMYLATLDIKIGYFNFKKTIDIDHIKDIETAHKFLNEGF
jgi:NDP-sugar pyrophosphorylase family protein